MNLRTIALTVALMVVAGEAHAQVLDAFDPAITARPRPDRSKRVPKYPIESNRSNEQGEVTLVVCIDDSGKVVAADMSKSSGYAALDEATMNWILSGPRFEPAYSGDKAVPVCNYVFTYVWSKHDRRAQDPTAQYLAWADLKPEERPSISSQVNGPIYPPVAIAKGVEGPVRLSLCITPFGRVTSTKPLEGDQESGLIRATSSWIGRFTFNPGKKNGEPVGVCGFPIKYDWVLPK